MASKYDDSITNTPFSSKSISIPRVKFSRSSMFANKLLIVINIDL